MKTTHATVRAAHLGDADRILAEYDEAIRNLPMGESANLLSRPYDKFKAAIENGLFFVVENAVGNFMAGAGAFDLADPAEKELGMCYVKREWRGFGLQTLLLRLRVCAATLGQVPDKSERSSSNQNYATLVIGVKPTNEHSAVNTIELGFEPLTVLSPALFATCASCRTPPPSDSRRKCCCDFFYLSDARRADTIEKSLQMEHWSRTRKNHQLIVTLKIRHLLDVDFRKTLQDTVHELRKC
jgi:hypothetical protein